jgi:hypothetical protein
MEINGLGIDKTPEKEKRKKILFTNEKSGNGCTQTKLGGDQYWSRINLARFPTVFLFLAKNGQIFDGFLVTSR